MLSQSLEKDYVDRGIQTSLPPDPSPRDWRSRHCLCETQLSSTPDWISEDETRESRISFNTLDETLDTESIASESAYIQSQGLNYHDSPSGLTLRNPQNSIHISAGSTFRCPSDASFSANRVVSLPTRNVSPPRKIKAISKQRIRIVSMPERGKHADPGVRGSSPSSQHLDHSGSTDYEQFERWDIDARPYPPDLPQTPSPPSSPESITIIGNEAHVPGSFLRRQYMEEGGRFLSTDLRLCKKHSTSSLGWISWANSPPRPIPALHGPLSLPYARCPS
ncbi:hypothetical protein B0H34DRAFT_352969 [Crassisporium funariophilum]|nr:hypothetical protein B0H34DRAFT_352969 [Crassisporium funariophilum]